MNLLSTQSLAGDHIDDLVREATAARLARSARPINDIAPAAWRRTLGRGVRGLSFVLGAASFRLDPSLDPAQRLERRPLRA